MEKAAISIISIIIFVSILCSRFDLDLAWTSVTKHSYQSILSSGSILNYYSAIYSGDRNYQTIPSLKWMPVEHALPSMYTTCWLLTV